MTDLHTHILPGVDDGSPDVDISLEMAAMAAESGTKHLVATPHANQYGYFENYYSEDLEDLFFLFRQELSDFGIPLRLYFGMEIFASFDMGKKIKNGRLISLNHSRYYLVEVFFDEEPAIIKRYLDIILDAGGVPLIAHPERYFCVQDNPAIVYDWLEMGCLTQSNKGSLFGRFGSNARDTVDVLLRNDLITCIASDSHGARRRTPRMAEAAAYLRETFGADTALLLLEENPKRILEDQAVDSCGRRPGGSYYF